MNDAKLKSLLERFYPRCPPVRFPGADQYQFAGLVRSAIEEASRGGARPVAVLDFGCGRGAVPLYDFRGPGVRVHGTDVDAAVRENPYLDEATVCEASIAYPDGTFDVVCSSHVFEHLSEPDRTFADLYRVLKPGGRLVVLTPNRNSLPALVSRLTPDRFHVWLNARRGRKERDTFPTLYRANTRATIRLPATRAGFRVESIELWEGRPEYFFFSPAIFYAGVAWERLVNAAPILAPLRSSLFAVLAK